MLIMKNQTEGCACEALLINLFPAFACAIGILLLQLSTFWRGYTGCVVSLLAKPEERTKHLLHCLAKP